MAQLSRRTGSFNSFLGTASAINNKTEEHKNDGNSNVRRIISSSNHKLVGKPQHNSRPVTPVGHRASEDHIHRIRFATSRADLRRNLHLISTSSSTNVKPNVEKSPESSESESDDNSIQSINWTAPLDITAYLYKPEYIIHPSSRDSKEEHIKANVHVQKTNVIKPQLTLSLPSIPEEEKSSTNSIQGEFTVNYIQKNKQTRKKCAFNRDVTDHSSFIKELNDDLLEISKETRRLEIQSPRTRAIKQEDRDEVKQRGYLTLKRLYELNPDLTETAARKHICGSPGKHWMGLSRVEVLEIMRQIRKEFGSDKYNNDDDPRMNFQRRNDKKLQKKKGTRKTKKPPKKSQATKERKPKTRLRTPTVPFLHVPGPKHLHTNICIRPWEATLDGWNYPRDDEKIEDCNENAQPEPEAKLEHNDNVSNLPRIMTAETSVQNSQTTADHPTISQHNNNNEEEDDYLTLEIFNPVFKVYR